MIDFFFGWIACWLWLANQEWILRSLRGYWEATQLALDSGLTVKQIWLAAFPGSSRPRVASHCSVCGGLRSFKVLAGGEKVCEGTHECAKEIVREIDNKLTYPERISQTILLGGHGELLALARKEIANSRPVEEEQGYINYRDDKGRLHRLDGPAAISPTRHLWYVRGRRLNFDRDIKPLLQNFFDTKRFEDLNAGQKIILAIALIKAYASDEDTEEEQDE